MYQSKPLSPGQLSEPTSPVGGLESLRWRGVKLCRCVHAVTGVEADCWPRLMTFDEVTQENAEFVVMGFPFAWSLIDVKTQ